MNNQEIEKLFSQLEDPSSVSHETKEVFATLAKTTLDYRDKVNKETGMIITVEDTRAALDLFLEFIQTGRAPSSKNQITLDLLKIWVKKFKSNIG